MAGYALTYPKFRAFTAATNLPLVGGKLYSYVVGTTTLKSLYADAALTTPLSNPVILDSNGEATIFGDGAYDLILKDSLDSQQWTETNVSFLTTSAIPTQSEWVIQTGPFTYLSVTQFSVTGDQTGTYSVNRRLKVVVSAGTKYGFVTASTFSAGVTTVTVLLDSGNLDSGLSAVSTGILSPSNVSIPAFDAILSGPYIDVRLYTSFAVAVASIGSTKTTLVIPNNQVVSTAVTVPSTLHIKLVGAGLFTKSGIGTIAFNYNFSAPDQQVFSGFTAGNITGLNEARPIWWGAKADGGVTDNTIPINCAVQAGPTYIKKGTSYYKITDKLSPTHSMWSDPGIDKAEIRQATTGKPGIDVAVSNISIKRLKVTGAQSAVDNLSEQAIYFHGTNDSTRISNLLVEECEIQTWGFEGIRFDFCSNFVAKKNTISNCVYTGIQTRNGNDFDFSENLISSIGPGTGGVLVGIAVTNTTNQAASSKRGKIHRNNVYTITATNGQGILLENGEYVSIIGNNVIDCFMGINVQSDVTGGVAKNNTVVGNNVINLTLSTMTSRKAGILLGGTSVVAQNLNTVCTGNTVVGYGTNTPSVYGAIHCYYNKGLICSNNTVSDSYVVGLELLEGNSYSVFSGNTINGMQTGATAGIRALVGNDNWTLIDGNIINAGDGTGIELAANNPLLIIGRNSITTSAANDIYVNNFTVIEESHLDTTEMAVTGTVVETNMRTLVIPAGSLMKHRGLRFTAWGTKSGTTSTKEIKFYWGTTVISIIPSANNTSNWRLVVEVFNDNAFNAQELSYTAWDGTTIIQGNVVSSQDTALGVTARLTGILGNSTDTILQKTWLVERL